jgi:hypothetical protein
VPIDALIGDFISGGAEWVSPARHDGGWDFDRRPGLALSRLICGRLTQRIIGSFNNAAVGTALGQGNGIQAFDRARQVIVLTGDGGFNMLMCEFLTAVHHKLPVKVVIFNNGAFGLIRLEAESIGVPPYRQGIDFPNPDFAAFARAAGGHGFAARKPGELKKAISDALSVTDRQSSTPRSLRTSFPTCRASTSSCSGRSRAPRSKRRCWPLRPLRVRRGPPSPESGRR